MRVMMRMLRTTYELSVSSTPILLIAEPTGPITYGTTYIVRPFIEPSKSLPSLAYASSGAIQLFVGPASSFVLVQMKVSCSTRATSFGFERCKWQPGSLLWLSGVKMPAAIASSVRRFFSSSDPSHQTTLSGLVSAAISVTHLRRFELFVSVFPDE